MIPGLNGRLTRRWFLGYCFFACGFGLQRLVVCSFSGLLRREPCISSAGDLCDLRCELPQVINEVAALTPDRFCVGLELAQTCLCRLAHGSSFRAHTLKMLRRLLPGLRHGGFSIGPRAGKQLFRFGLRSSNDALCLLSCADAAVLRFLTCCDGDLLGRLSRLLEDAFRLFGDLPECLLDRSLR